MNTALAAASNICTWTYFVNPAWQHVPSNRSRYIQYGLWEKVQKYHVNIQSVCVTVRCGTFCLGAVIKPLNQGTSCFNLKPAWASLNGFQLPISTLAYSTTLCKWIQILLPHTRRASRWHAASCLEMDVLWRSTEVILAGYLKGKSARELSDDGHKEGV